MILAIGVPPPEQVAPYVAWFGPVGIAFGLLTLVVLYFCRRDMLRRYDELKALHYARDKNEDRVIAALERVSGIVEGFNIVTQNLAAHTQEEMRVLAALTAAVGEIGYGVKRVLEKEQKS